MYLSTFGSITEETKTVSAFFYRMITPTRDDSLPASFLKIDTTTFLFAALRAIQFTPGNIDDDVMFDCFTLASLV